LDGESRELMAHLKAVCFVRPTAENFQLLAKELRKPKYGEYHLFFSNIIPTNYLEELAEADEHEIVQQVQEFYGDFYAINPDLVSLNIETYIGLDSAGRGQVIQRTVDGLAALLLAFRKKPIIRVQRNSDMCMRIAQDLAKVITMEKSLFDFRRGDTSPVVLVLDRRNDPVTPLLHQWTYQAMVHELLTIKNNRVDLSNVPGVKKEMQEVVLSPEQDSFYKANMYSNFGDLGANIRALVDEYQAKTKNNQNIQTIADMKRFVEEYPEFRKLSGNVSKHVALVGELSRLVDKRHLLAVSEVEQDLACHQDHSAAIKKLMRLFEEGAGEPHELLKAVMLYALRYETSSSSAQKLDLLFDKLSAVGVPPQQIGLVSTLIAYAGQAARVGDLFENQSLMQLARSTLARGLKGVENIFTEHTPYLHTILNLLLTARLPDNDYPCVFGSLPRERPQDVFVFIVGGATYEEALTVHRFNENPDFGARIVLAGSTIHNSTSFMKDLERARDFQESSFSGKRRL